MKGCAFGPCEKSSERGGPGEMMEMEGVERRGRPYLWPTWLAGLLGGDKHCDWAVWFKAHHTYPKRPDANENRLAAWRVNHAAMVRDRVGQLRASGWDVTVESQNKFRYHGEAATMGGCPDIIAVRDDEALLPDCKSGRESAADFWQAAIYALVAPLAKELRERFMGRQVSGVIAYRDRDRLISASDLLAGRSAIIEAVLRAASHEEPMRTPSATECRYCDIACCPDRVTSEPDQAEEVVDTTGGLF